MKISKAWIGLGAGLLVGGCASVEMAKYTVTSFPEVALKDKAKVKIVAASDSLGNAVAKIRKGFAANGKFSVVEEDADYWFILSGAGQWKNGGSQNVWSVRKEETGSGGGETLVAEKRNYSSAAKGVSVAVYETKKLAPVTYFEIPVYGGDATAGAVKGEAALGAAYDAEVAERVMDAFLTQKKDIETPMPLEADGALRNAFAKGDYKAFLETYKKTNGKMDLAKFCSDVRAGTYKGGDADKKLGNYYLYLLVRETATLDPEKLAQIKAEQTEILRTAEADGLVEAVPVALARLEYKLANVE